MKPSLKKLRETLKAKAQLEAFTPYRRTLDFRRDKKLQEWFNEHCQGHPLREADQIISGGLERNEITSDQADILATVLGFAGEKAFGVSDL